MNRLFQSTPVAKEFFASVTWDGRRKLPVVVFSDMGGIDIEEVAEKHPQHVSRTHFSTLLPPSTFRAKEAVASTGVTGQDLTRLVPIVEKLMDLFLRYDLTLSFEEAAFGSETTLRIPRLETCPRCSGSGSADGASAVSCSACGGRGQVRFTQGFFTVARTCPQCQGEGRVIKDPCRECRGEGRVEQERSITVQIPAGVDTGARMRLAGEGEHGRRGGPPGPRRDGCPCC